MLLLINHCWPRLGAVLSVLSSLAFLAAGAAGHSMFMIVLSAAFLALSLVKIARKRRGTPPARS